MAVQRLTFAVKVFAQHAHAWLGKYPNSELRTPKHQIPNKFEGQKSGRKGGREEGRKGGREEGRKGGREKGGREEGRKGGREEGKTEDAVACSRGESIAATEVVSGVFVMWIC